MGAGATMGAGAGVGLGASSTALGAAGAGGFSTAAAGTATAGLAGAGMALGGFGLMALGTYALGSFISGRMSSASAPIEEPTKGDFAATGIRSALAGGALIAAFRKAGENDSAVMLQGSLNFGPQEWMFANQVNFADAIDFARSITPEYLIQLRGNNAISLYDAMASPFTTELVEILTQKILAAPKRQSSLLLIKEVSWVLPAAPLAGSSMS